MSLKCGIVGLPNVGKSTLFNALTKASIAATANYPFCTIEPNVGVVPVPDLRLDQLATLVKPQNVVPNTMQFVDIAGLVKGAATGEGLGNQFLANIRETDAIIHVVRCFVDDDVVHVSGRVNPLEDVATIETELALADLESIERRLYKASQLAKTGQKQLVQEKAWLERLQAHLNQGLAARHFKTQEGDPLLASLQLLTAKPLLYLANVDEAGFTQNPLLEALEKLAEQENTVVVPICAKLEAEMAGLCEQEKLEFLQTIGLQQTGLDRFIYSAYKLLDLKTFFTAGKKEVRAWTFTNGMKAPQAAGVIHTDFEKGFIRAEVIHFDHFIAFGGEQGAKDAGKWQLEGKDYVMQDGDVVYFRFNV